MVLTSLFSNQHCVMRSMLFLTRKHYKIFRIVISFIPIYVMDYFSRL